MIEKMPEDLTLLQVAYEENNFEFSNLTAEKESAEYSAYDLKINGLTIKFRTSKITPTKTGQFVTLWKRIENGPIAPFESSDEIDFVIVSSRNENHFGQFIFPKSVLIKKGIFTDKKEGKRAIRVYPPWDVANNKQALKTQEWQLDYFIDFKEVDKNRLEKLLKT